jgi:hypothetical protein
MIEQHLPSYERDFNSEVQRLRDIAARFERASRHCFKSKVQRFIDIVERFEDWTKETGRLYSIRRRTAWIERFTKIQREKRKWINFAEIAEMCSELDESGVPNEAARENAYRNLECDVIDGDFQENGRSRVHCLHPLTVARMTPGRLNDVIKYDYDGHRGRSQYLPYCWCSRGAYERFASKHNLPISPPRFRPEHADTAVVAQPTASETLPRVIAERRRPAEERIRQELEKKAPEYIDTPGDKTYWDIAKSLVETTGNARSTEIDKTSKALKRYYENRLKDRPQD